MAHYGTAFFTAGPDLTDLSDLLSIIGNIPILMAEVSSSPADYTPLLTIM
jgi:hypothetical protein